MKYNVFTLLKTDVINVCACVCGCVYDLACVYACDTKTLDISV